MSYLMTRGKVVQLINQFKHLYMRVSSRNWTPVANHQIYMNTNYSSLILLR